MKLRTKIIAALLAVSAGIALLGDETRGTFQVTGFEYDDQCSFLCTGSCKVYVIMECFHFGDTEDHCNLGDDKRIPEGTTSCESHFNGFDPDSGLPTYRCGCPSS